MENNESPSLGREWIEMGTVLSDGDEAVVSLLGEGVD